jgi:hypothetical protein
VCIPKSWLRTILLYFPSPDSSDEGKIEKCSITVLPDVTFRQLEDMVTSNLPIPNEVRLWNGEQLICDDDDVRRLFASVPANAPPMMVACIPLPPPCPSDPCDEVREPLLPAFSDLSQNLDNMSDQADE